MASSLVGEALTSKGQIQDLVLREWDPRYSREAIVLEEGTYKVGDVIEEANPAASANGASPSFTDVICLENVTIGSGQTRDVAAIAHGPALVNLDAVVRTSGSETDSQLITRLQNLRAQGVRFVREPAHSNTLDLNASSI